MNRVEMTAVLESKDALRYTLAKVAVCECQLRYVGVAQEAGSDRKLNFLCPAKALDQVAEDLDKEELGTKLNLKGYLATSSARSAKLILHITEYEKGV